MKIYTVTVDTDDGMFTSAHTSEDDAYETLRGNYADTVEADDRDAIVRDLEGQGLTYKVDEHEFPEVLAVSIGNPYDEGGVKLYGPFFDADEAMQFAYREMSADWHLPTLNDPSEHNQEGN